jgi:glycosyltransferase involved in cell wall biosynthesis
VAAILNTHELELTIVMPCLNEAETLAICIQKARKFLADSKISGEVLIADNGSTDGSRDIALAQGARVVSIPVRGYGAPIGGINAAKGRCVIMGDADDSYDFSALQPFVERLRAGFIWCIGQWASVGFGPLEYAAMFRILIISLTAIAIGFQLALSGFLSAILAIPTR